MLELLAAVAVVLLALVLLDLLYKRNYKPEQSADEHHLVETDTGHEVSLWRHRATSLTDPTPVLMVHGLGTTHRSLSLDDEVGLAQYLANERGRDVWLLELRGRGESDVPGEPWSFDDYYRHDVPTAVEYVLQETGSQELDWVGHSMGGMLYYACAGTGGLDGRFRRAVTVGSPLVIEHHTVLSALSHLGRYFTWLLTSIRRSYLLPFFARLNAAIFPLIPRRISLFLFDKENVETENVRKASTVAVSMMCLVLLDDFSRWITTGEWRSRDGTVDYAAGVDDIKTPTLVIAGENDVLVPRPDVETAYYQLGTPEDDKQLLIAGEEDGFDRDYAHADMMLSKPAAEELYPVIADWLEDSESQQEEERTAEGRHG